MNICDKVSYPTRQLAIDAIREISKRDKQSMHPYRCLSCKEYHISTSGKKKRIPKVYTNSVEIKPKSKKVKDKKKRNFKPEVPIVTTQKLMSKETAQNLKRLINGANEIEKQKTINK